MKRMFKSYAECEAAYQRASNLETIQGQLINAMLNKEPVGAMRQGAFTARVYRATSPCGGIVSVTFRHAGQADYTTVHNVDEWAAVRSTWVVTHTDEANQKLRQLMYDVVAYRNAKVQESDHAFYAKCRETESILVPPK